MLPDGFYFKLKLPVAEKGHLLSSRLQTLAGTYGHAIAVAHRRQSPVAFCTLANENRLLSCRAGFVAVRPKTLKMGCLAQRSFHLEMRAHSIPSITHTSAPAVSHVDSFKVGVEPAHPQPAVPTQLPDRLKIAPDDARASPGLKMTLNGLAGPAPGLGTADAALSYPELGRCCALSAHRWVRVQRAANQRCDNKPAEYRPPTDQRRWLNATTAVVANTIA